MTPTQKAAMEQGKEALELSRTFILRAIERAVERNLPSDTIRDLNDELAYHDQSIAALRAALAETAEPVHQYRNPHCSDWYDGVPDHHDGHGPYEVRTLYTQPPAPAVEHDCICGRKWRQSKYGWVFRTPPDMLEQGSVDYKPLTDPHDHPEPHSYKWTQSEMDYINKRVKVALQASQALTTARLYIEVENGRVQAVYGDPLPGNIVVGFFVRDFDDIEAGAPDPVDDLPDNIEFTHYL